MLPNMTTERFHTRRGSDIVNTDTVLGVLGYFEFMPCVRLSVFRA